MAAFFIHRYLRVRSLQQLVLPHTRSGAEGNRPCERPRVPDKDSVSVHRLRPSGSLANRGQWAGLPVLPSAGSLKQGSPGAPATPASSAFSGPSTNPSASSLLAPHRAVLKEKLRGRGGAVVVFQRHAGEGRALAPPPPLRHRVVNQRGKRGSGPTGPPSSDSGCDTKPRPGGLMSRLCSRHMSDVELKREPAPLPSNPEEAWEHKGPALPGCREY